jgi:hypothetical protein
MAQPVSEVLAPQILPTTSPDISPHIDSIHSDMETTDLVWLDIEEDDINISVDATP